MRMKDYDVILASGAEHLRGRFEQLGYRVYVSGLNYDERRMFPNGDIYVRIDGVEELADRPVKVIQSCTGSGTADRERFTTSDRVVELLLILSVLQRPVRTDTVGHKKYKWSPVPPPSNVEVVLTFQPYSLQDKAFLTGEAVSARWATELIARECNKVWVVNPHAPPDTDWVVRLRERGVYEEIDIVPDLVRHCAKRFCRDDYVVVAPDEGGQERFSVRGFGKCRNNSFAVEVQGELDVAGQEVIVVDDLTKSGSTLLKAAERLRALGAAGVAMAVVHVLPLVDRGEELLQRLVRLSNGRIVTTNTVFTETFCVENPDLTYNIVDSLVKALG